MNQITKKKIKILKEIRKLPYAFDNEKFEELTEQFHELFKGTENDDFGLMDSDETPFVFFAEAWLKGHNETNRFWRKKIREEMAYLKKHYQGSWSVNGAFIRLLENRLLKKRLEKIIELERLCRTK